uniref:Uncharacterized protein n=1 Tax=Heterorhabditis bacteriophora TaxID=37862 RepID=A0A1I7WCX7_HETBA
MSWSMTRQTLNHYCITPRQKGVNPAPQRGSGQTCVVPGEGRFSSFLRLDFKITII